MPSAVSVNGIGVTYAIPVTIAEAAYGGLFGETDTCAGIAVLATLSPRGPSVVFVVTGVAAGTCAATFADASSQTIVVPVTVTVTGIQINSTGSGGGSPRR